MPIYCITVPDTTQMPCSTVNVSYGIRNMRYGEDNIDLLKYVQYELDNGVVQESMGASNILQVELLGRITQVSLY